MQQYSAIQVANYFIKKSIGDQSPIDILKLIKLCYIAQGVSFWKNNILLFNERCEAWRYGPVVPQIYGEFKHYAGKDIIALGGYPLGLDAEGNPIYPSIDDNDQESKKVLDFVWDSFKQYTSLQLSTWTHRENSAWSSAMKNKKIFGNNPLITPEMLKEEFSQVLAWER